MATTAVAVAAAAAEPVLSCNAGCSRAPAAAGVAYGLALWLAACASAPRLPVPIETVAPTAVAFHACVHELSLQFGRLELVDAEGFRLQTAWAPVAEPSGERRAFVFVVDGQIAVVVEARWLAAPLLGLPEWSAVELDRVGSQRLATRLAAALRALPPD